MIMQKRHVINVDVATIWTSPSSPDPTDATAVTSPTSMDEWLRVLDYNNRIQLYNDNKTQTQVLYGTVVEVIEEKGDWVFVTVEDQPSLKDKRGYPGWMPKAQITQMDWPAESENLPHAYANIHGVVLYKDKTTAGLKLCFLTSLPVINEDAEWAELYTPQGSQWVKTADVTIRKKTDKPDVSGEKIVETGKTFLGLPYLWAGNSSYGYDCSGFAYSMHKAFGIVIPRDASNQAKYGENVPLDQLQPGDLLFFAFEKGKGSLHHVAISLGGTLMIHAPKTGRSIEILDLENEEVYREELCGARRYWRITEAIDFHAVK
ncbi:C40 family peptidase [Brevibacillus daliensis]|uniref:C40 family peptidase n=1 Tax=Brevibacillus daliensis TaxID=2892995 RepID=UPI001E33E9A2|nr:C40 family peptidase [Brevibacillus daliensis]